MNTERMIQAANDMLLLQQTKMREVRDVLFSALPPGQAEEAYRAVDELVGGIRDKMMEINNALLDEMLSTSRQTATAIEDSRDRERERRERTSEN